MKILVTGSEGLIGRALCPLLAKHGIEVTRADLRCDPPLDINHLRYGHLVGIDGIIHLAALTRVLWCEEDPFRCVRNNIEGTAHVIRAAKSMTPAFPPWVLFTSSREVYEETYPDGPLQLLKPVDEDEPCRPINTYGFTKLLGERMLRDASLRSAVARLSNVYGDVEDYLERLVPAFAKAAAKGKPLIVRGSLRKTFDFTHVSDIAKALLLLAIRLQETKTPTTECFNLVSGRGTTLGDLVRLAAKNAGEKLQFIQEPANKSESQFFIGNPRKARDTLGWQAEIAIEDGFSRLVEDFRRKDGEN